jgi:hypothetical protein
VFSYSSWVRYRPGDPWQNVSTVTSANEYDAFSHVEAAGRTKAGWAHGGQFRVGTSMVVLPANVEPYRKVRRK